jgi:hypothetical protein
VIGALARLRVDVAARLPGWQDTARARKALADQIAQGLRRDGRLEVLARGRRLQGFVLAWNEPQGWIGGPLHTVLVEVEPDCAAATEWAVGVIDRLGGFLDGPLDLTVRALHRGLRERLVERGLGVDSVVLHGAPGPALVTLLARLDPPEDLAHLGLDLAPLAPHHVGDVVDLSRRVFTESPEYCWFGATTPHLARRRQELTNGTLPALRRVVLERGQVVGFFSSTLSDRPGWGRVGGMEMVLAPAVQRRGIAKTAYRLILDWLVTNRATGFRGGTSQPAVMHLGRLMGRVPIDTHHRRGTRFPLAHFAPVLG